MAWIKRNLFFVVGLAVAGVLLLGAGFYLYVSWDDSQTAYGELQTKTQSLDAIVAADPFPNAENLQQIKDEQQRVDEFKKTARQHFGAPEKMEGLDNASFKALLESRLASLMRDAERTGVRLPEKYDFTFGEQRKVLQIPDKALIPLATHLNDISDLCHVLFAARVHSIVSIKRTTVGTNDTSSSTDFLLGKKVVTNSVTGAVVYPYEISFQGFSAELSEVLVELRDAPSAYNVRTINVERGTTAEASAAPSMVGLPQGMTPSMASRYGLGPYARQPLPAATTSSRPNEPVLEPKLLRVTIGLDIVKLPVASAPVADAKSTIVTTPSEQSSRQ